MFLSSPYSSVSSGQSFSELASFGTQAFDFIGVCFAIEVTGEMRRLRPVAEGPRQELADPGRLLDAGQLVSIIDRTYRLEEVPEALVYFGPGQPKGEISVAIGKSNSRKRRAACSSS